MSALPPIGKYKWLKSIFYRNLLSPRKQYGCALNNLTIPEGSRILDIGCGYAAPDLMRFGFPQSISVGIDMVDHFNKLAAPEVRFGRADASQLPFQDKVFHAVICRSVVEHLDDPTGTLQEVYRVLAPGGYFVFLTPNRYDYVSLIATIIPNKFHGKIVYATTRRKEKDTFPTRYRANTTTALSKLANAIGYEIVFFKLLREHPHYLRFNPLLYLIGIMYEQTVERMCEKIRPWILGVFRRPLPKSDFNQGGLRGA